MMINDPMAGFWSERMVVMRFASMTVLMSEIMIVEMIDYMAVNWVGLPSGSVDG